MNTSFRLGAVALAFVTLPALAQRLPTGSPVERQPKSARELERQGDNVWKRDQATSRYDLPPLDSAVYKQTIEDFHEGRADVVEDIHAVWGEFLSASGEYFIALQISKATGGDFVDGTSVVLFGEILDANRKSVLGFQTARPLVASNGLLYTDVSLKLPPGLYSTTIGLAIGNTPRSMVSAPLAADPIDAKVFGVSRLILSDNVFPLTTPQKPDDPYTFGGIKVVPRGDLTFASARDIWIFLALRNPGVDDKQTPAIRGRVVLNGPFGDASRRRALPVSDLTPMPLQGFDKHWGLGIPIDTSKLAAGEYSVTVELTDTLLDRTWSAGEQFRVVAP